MSRVGGAVPLVAAALLAAALMLGVWQGFRYQRLVDSIEQLEAEQRDWLQDNKRAVASIAVFRSPARLDAIASEQLGLRADVAEQVHITLTPAAVGAP
jgi:hypothetical protein